MTTKFTCVALEVTQDGSAVELRIYCPGSDVFVNEYAIIQRVELKGPGDDLASDTWEELVRRGQGTAVALGCDFVDCLGAPPEAQGLSVFLLSHCDEDDESPRDVAYKTSAHRSLAAAQATAQADRDAGDAHRQLAWTRADTVYGEAHLARDPSNGRYEYVVRRVPVE